MVNTRNPKTFVLKKQKYGEIRSIKVNNGLATIATIEQCKEYIASFTVTSSVSISLLFRGNNGVVGSL